MMQYEMEELIPILAGLSEKYTSKESSSISYETARQLLGAIEYCIQEIRLGDTEGILVLEKQNKLPAKDAYERGYQLVIDKVKKVNEIYCDNIDSFSDYGNSNLADTVRKGIPGFLLHYDVRFRPQDHILTMDYPVLNQSEFENLCGVDVIYEYINAICIEQQFLHCFSEQFIRNLLRRYHSDYENMFFNISFPVLVYVLSCGMIKKNMEDCTWTKSDEKAMMEYCSQLSSEDLKKQIRTLLLGMMEYLHLPIETHYRYFFHGMEEFVILLKRAMEHDCIESLFCQDTTF